MKTEMHTSPDGKLDLVVEFDDGDVRIGFAQSQWHTHANLLIGDYGETEIEGLQAFKEAILTDKLVIAVVREGTALVYVFVTDEPAVERDFLLDGQTLELRYWSGQSWGGGDEAN